MADRAFTADDAHVAIDDSSASTAAREDDASASPDLRAALRHATAELHRHLDRAPDQAALLAPEITHERYATIMAKHRHALAICEEAVTALETERPTDLTPYRPRLPALDADLATLGAAGLPTVQPTPYVASPAEAVPIRDPAVARGRYLGTRYVLEGSTLGAPAIVRRLERHLPALSAHTFAFWRLQAEEAPAWHALARSLASLPPRGTLAVAAIAAARDTFRVFLSAFGADGTEPCLPPGADGPRARTRS